MKSTIKVLVSVLALGVAGFATTASAQEKGKGKGQMSAEQRITQIETAVGTLSAEQKTTSISPTRVATVKPVRIPIMLLAFAMIFLQRIGDVYEC